MIGPLNNLTTQINCFGNSTWQLVHPVPIKITQGHRLLSTNMSEIQMPGHNLGTVNQVITTVYPVPML